MERVYRRQRDNAFTISLFEQVMSPLVSHRYPRLIRFSLCFMFLVSSNNKSQASDRWRQRKRDTEIFSLVPLFFQPMLWSCTTYLRMLMFNNEWQLLLTLRLILSICLFWFSNSEPMSSAMFLKLPIIVFTWPMFSSISSSRASFVILKVNPVYLQLATLCAF